MKLIVDIKDEKAAFILELLESFSYVKTKPLESSSNKENILKGLKNSVEEVNLIKAGKRKGIPVKDLLDEL